MWTLFYILHLKQLDQKQLRERHFIQARDKSRDFQQQRVDAQLLYMIMDESNADEILTYCVLVLLCA